ncbi:MAG: hypothetical protein AAF605_09100, partial [Myxococcota bacterium]
FVETLLLRLWVEDVHHILLHARLSLTVFGILRPVGSRHPVYLMAGQRVRRPALGSRTNS